MKRLPPPAARALAAALAAALACARPGPAAAAAAGERSAAAPDSAAGVLLVADPSVDGPLERALARMAGVIPGSDSLVDWPLFRAHPQRTVDLVLATLQPVRRDLWLGAPNAVWRVRVLQRLTGLEFRGATRAKLTPEETRALAPDSLHQVRFAGEDRAQGMTWTAPVDAQRAILARWRMWWANGVRKPPLPMRTHADDSSWWY